jgi:hypothetical protein
MVCTSSKDVYVELQYIIWSTTEESCNNGLVKEICYKKPMSELYCDAMLSWKGTLKFNTKKLP